ncbi:hypothetical protein BG261_08290 [Floricoccus tropicus]|uniref:Uncharacterized protein n=1 Tax=Floricoccus tropicus TaxID=1859473 RepID=A0A1E8GJ16_9LACT|nr:hypothetical protein [Floricoccus tropicus]OFI48272.1 hypothetical protein BG261_08290 [Floricoccus tropicus]
MNQSKKLDKFFNIIEKIFNLTILILGILLVGFSIIGLINLGKDATILFLSLIFLGLTLIFQSLKKLLKDFNKASKKVRNQIDNLYLTFSLLTGLSFVVLAFYFYKVDSDSEGLHRILPIGIIFAIMAILNIGMKIYEKYNSQKTKH